MTVAVPTTVLLIVPVITPPASVEPLILSTSTPPRLELNETALPLTGLLNSSYNVTVTVEFETLSAGTVSGIALTMLTSASIAATITVMLSVASSNPAVPSGALLLSDAVTVTLAGAYSS